MLIAVPRATARAVGFGDRLFDNWSLFVCLLLAFWAVAILFTRWRASRARERGIAAASIDGDWNVKSADAMLTDRAQRAVAQFRSSGDPLSTADLLRAEAEAAQAQLDSEYAPVRVFLWAIPVIGLIGTMMSIGQAARAFAALMLSAGREVEDIRNALVGAAASVGGSFEVTMAALLMAVVVMALMLVIQQRERAVLQTIDDFCRTRLLPGMLTKPEDETVPLLRQLVEQDRAVNLAITEKLESIEKTLSARPEAPAAVAAVESAASVTAQYAPAVSSVGTPAAAGAPALVNMHRAEELRASLEELRDSVRALRPFLDRVAENLRRQADEAGQPLSIRVRVQAKPKASSAAAD